MYNQEILDKIITKYGKEKAAEFCEIASMMYEIKSTACNDCRNKAEYDFELDWWSEAANSLNQQICLPKPS